MKRARHDQRQGKSPSTQAGEFVREEIHHIREGRHGARSAKQAIAIGLSEARRAGVKLAPPKAGTTSEKTRKAAQRETARGGARPARSSKRARASERALEREPAAAASRRALSGHAKRAARARSGAARSASARKGARTREASRP